MKKIRQKQFYFSPFEAALWGGSVLLILAAFMAFDRTNCLSLAASLVGVTSLIFNAKAHPLGQLLMVVFSLLYGIVSYTFAYYGEMLTYLGMTAPMSVFSLISWLRHPYRGDAAEVQVGTVGRRAKAGIAAAALPVTVLFYFILKYFHTANLLPSTLSVTTSFLAVCLTACRTPYFALAYAANDVVLILLWTLASLSDPRYVSVTVCFVAFLVNDLYGFFHWRSIRQRQAEASA